MSETYTPACLLLRCGDRVGNVDQCRALTTVSEVDDNGNEVILQRLNDDEVKNLIHEIQSANWRERNCHNCAMLIDSACPTHGFIGKATYGRIGKDGIDYVTLSYCYHRHPRETGGRRVNRRVIVRWARFCAARASISAMEARVADTRHTDAAAAGRAAGRAAAAADAARATADHDAARAAYDAARAADYAATAAVYAAYDAATDAYAAAERMLCARELWRLIEKWGDQDHDTGKANTQEDDDDDD